MLAVAVRADTLGTVRCRNAANAEWNLEALHHKTAIYRRPTSHSFPGGVGRSDAHCGLMDRFSVDNLVAALSRVCASLSDARSARRNESLEGFSRTFRRGFPHLPLFVQPLQRLPSRCLAAGLTPLPVRTP